MTNASAWFALVGALGGIVLTGTFSLATAILNHRWAEQASQRADREQQIRIATDRLRAVFHDYLVATNAYYHAIRRMHIEALRGNKFDRWEYVKNESRESHEEYQYLTISAGSEVGQYAQVYNELLDQLAEVARDGDNKRWEITEPETHESRDRVRAAMRAELGVLD